MLWPEKDGISRCGLLPGATPEQIERVEAGLRGKLPTELVDFLLWADGGLFANNRYVIYSSGDGIHPAETLRAANSGRQDELAMILVGREATEEFGFRIEDLPAESCPVYFYLHEERELDKVANSFREFVHWMLNQRGE